MKVTVIVPTYNGAAKIPYLLRALADQTYSEFELIIMIDGSTDNTLGVLKDFNSKFDSMVVVEQENLGRAAVRNNGVERASGDLLIFYDDDMEPNQDSIQKHVDFHRVEQESILCGNPIELTDESKTDIQNYKASKTIEWTKHFQDGLNKIPTSTPFLTAANMSIKKDLFKKIGGFDVRLNDIEDLEFGMRAQKKKWILSSTNQIKQSIMII